MGSASDNEEESEESMDIVTPQQVGDMSPVKACSHRRLIDNVLTKDGKRTGKVHCVECGAHFDDPYHGLK